MYSRFTKLFKSLNKTRNALMSAFKSIVKGEDFSQNIDELEALLLSADVGIDTTDEIIEWLRENRGNSNFRIDLKNYFISLLENEFNENRENSKSKYVYFIVGVNGTGKTTSAAKLANYLKKQNQKVMMVGADTYRAAAAQQLEKWSKIANIDLVCNPESRDPSSVVFDGLSAARARGFQSVVVDTAGRLHTYKNLMLEVEKMYRVTSKKFSDFNIITYLTLDVNLGQNSLIQAREFNEHIPINGIMLTKMDGTAKGGIVFPVYRELKIPVKYVGIGEGLDDFMEFDPKQYVESLIGQDD